MPVIAAVVLAAASLLPSAAATDGPGSPQVALQNKLDSLARRARPGTLGITVLDLRSGAAWRVNATRGYPMMSVFKVPLAATVLALADSHRISLDQRVVITRTDLRGYSAISDHFHGERMTFTVRQLLAAAVSHSDNTAADALVRFVGGPQIVTTFLRTHGIEDMRVDLDEAGMGRIFGALGDAAAPPADETPAQEDQRLQRGYQAFLADPRNRGTPDAAAMLLRKLWRNELLTPASTRHLIGLMQAQRLPRRLRNGVPSHVRLADKCGTSYTLDGLTAAYNDIGILSWPDGHTVIIAAFLTASPASKAERDAIFAELARDTVAVLHP
jgi:beta-lactamase class A